MTAGHFQILSFQTVRGDPHRLQMENETARESVGTEALPHPRRSCPSPHAVRGRQRP